MERDCCRDTVGMGDNGCDILAIVMLGIGIGFFDDSVQFAYDLLRVNVPDGVVTV